jgi:hypothetical protein
LHQINHLLPSAFQPYLTAFQTFLFCQIHLAYAYSPAHQDSQQQNNITAFKAYLLFQVQKAYVYSSAFQIINHQDHISYRSCRPWWMASTNINLNHQDHKWMANSNINFPPTHLTLRH